MRVFLWISATTLHPRHRRILCPALAAGTKQVEGIALRCPRPAGRNEREKDTRFAIRFTAPDAALGAGGRRSAAIPTVGVRRRRRLKCGAVKNLYAGHGFQNEMLPSKQVEGIALRCPRPGGRNEREKDTRSAIRFTAPDAALGAGRRRSAAIPTDQKLAREGRVRASVLVAFLSQGLCG